MVACDPDVMTIEQFKKSLQSLGLLETTTNSVAQSTDQSQAIIDSRLFATIPPLEHRFSNQEQSLIEREREVWGEGREFGSRG